MKKIYIVLLSCISLIANAQVDISIAGEDTVCIGEKLTYTVETSSSSNHYVSRDSNSSGSLYLGYEKDVFTNTFSFDLWVKPTRTINMKGESNNCSGSVSVPLANSNQNWAVYAGNAGYGRMGVGLTIGTNGLMVGEHSENILVSRLSYSTSITDWVHVAIVYRPDSIYLYLDGNLVRKRPTPCPGNTKCVPSTLVAARYSPEFQGNIDEFRLWDIALTPEQAKSIKDKKLLNEVGGLRYYASFDGEKFERALGDIGTNEMTVNGMSPDANIKSDSSSLNTYSGNDINNLNLFSPDDINYAWSTGEAGASIEYFPVNPSNSLSVAGTINGSTLYDTIEIVGKECNSETYYDTIQVYDTITVQNQSSLIPQENLVAHFPFNGNAKDDSGNGYDGTIYGAQPTEDRFGNSNSAFYFDGQNDRIDLGNDLIISGKNISYSCWFRSAEKGIVISAGNRNSYILMKSYADSIHSGFYLSDETDGHGSDTRKIYVDPDQWHHAVVTYDGVNHNFYLDGILVDTRLAEGDVFSNQTVYQNFGVYQYFGSNYQGWFKGEMDEIRFYNKVLSDQEVYSLFSEGSCIETVYDTITTEIIDTSYVSFHDTLSSFQPMIDTVLRQKTKTFASSISVSGNLAVLGAGWENTTVANKAGAVYIYKREGEKWILQQRLISPQGQYDGIFGHSVATDGKHIVITEPNRQSAYIYSNKNKIWSLDTSFQVNNVSTEKYGVSCAIEDSLVVIGSGAVFATYCNAVGSAYVYEKSENKWINTSILQPSEGQQHDDFANNLSISRGVIAVGAGKSECYPEGKGYVCIFEKLNNSWKETAKIAAPDGQDKDRFGINVYLDRNSLFVQAMNSVYYFEKKDTWTFVQKIESPTDAKEDNFGSSPVYDNNLLFIGAWGDDEILQNSGAAYIYEKTNSGFKKLSKIKSSQPEIDGKHGFGYLNYDANYLFLNGGYHDSTVHIYKLTDSYFEIHDTTLVTVRDTVYTEIYDTSYVTVYDTVRNHYQEGLISYYPFDGDASDHGTLGKDGKVVGAKLTEDRKGKANSAYYFDGNDDYIEIPDSLAICDDFTIAFWAKSESTGTGNILCDGSVRASGNDFLINFRNDDIGIRADKTGSILNLEYSSPKSLSGLKLRNKWVHVTWVMKSNYSKLYLNGDEIASLDIKGSNKGFHDAYTYIGARKVWSTMDSFFKGSLDDIRIYNTPLRTAQVSALYRDEAIELDTISTVYERISVTDTLVIDAVLTGYSAPFNQNTLKIYPNPAKDHVCINTGNYNLMNGYKIRIFNQLGVTVFETEVEEVLYEINLSTWTGKGLYFLQLIDNRGNIMDIRKIVLQ